MTDEQIKQAAFMRALYNEEGVDRALEEYTK